MSLDAVYLALPFSFPRVGESGVTEIIIDLLIQLAVILFAAKIAGKLAARFLKLPGNGRTGGRYTYRSLRLGRHQHTRIWTAVPYSSSGWRTGGDPGQQ